VYSPHIKQDEPLKIECGHFLECIQTGKTPLTSAERGLEVVKILEASSKSLRQHGNPVLLATAHAIRPTAFASSNGHGNGNGKAAAPQKTVRKARASLRRPIVP